MQEREGFISLLEEPKGFAEAEWEGGNYGWEDVRLFLACRMMYGNKVGGKVIFA